MQLLGASAPSADVVIEQATAAARGGAPFLLWSDGHDVFAVIGQAGDAPAEVLNWARRFVPEFAA